MSPDAIRVYFRLNYGYVPNDYILDLIGDIFEFQEEEFNLSNLNKLLVSIMYEVEQLKQDIIRAGMDIRPDFEMLAFGRAVENMESDLFEFNNPMDDFYDDF